MLQDKGRMIDVRGFIKYGLYFDKSFMRSGNGTELTKQQDPEFAPRYMQEHFERFSYLLANPYAEDKEKILIAENENNTTLANTRNSSLVDDIDEKIKSYWNSLFSHGGNTSAIQNNTIADHIDNKIRSYWNSIREAVVHNYIKWTQ